MNSEISSPTTQDRLRAAIRKLRTTSMSLSDLIPLLQKAADDLDYHSHQESDPYEPMQY